MSTKKAISTSFVAIFILIITQIIAQSIASMFVIIKIPTGICNIIAGIIYAGLTYLILKMFISKIIKLPTSDFGMPKFAIKIRWILIAVLLPFVIKGSYLLIFNGKYVSSNMNGNQMFNTLSAGVAFTGIAAGFVEEMVFRGVILNALKKRWNIKVAVIVPSMLFGIVHVLGQDFSIGSCLLVIIAGTMVGVMFSMIAIESGSVWNSGIVHAIWNVVIIGGGLAIGEKMDKYSIMTYVLNSKDFAITGGEYGKENKYDDNIFFQKYSQMSRSQQGLAGAGEWETLRKLLPDFKDKRVLDLGCGYGWHCIYAMEHGASSVVGVDISHKMLEVAKEKTHFPQVEYKCCAIEDVEFPEESFDVILSSLAFHYVADYEILVKKIYRILKSGGKLVFTVEHPVFTAYGTQDWHYNEKGEILHFPVDNYYYEGKRTAVFLGEKVTKYHRTLTTYLNTLLSNGFIINHIVEPQPPEYMMDIPGMQDEMRRPMMLIVSANKKVDR